LSTFLLHLCRFLSLLDFLLQQSFLRDLLDVFAHLEVVLVLEIVAVDRFKGQVQSSLLVLFHASLFHLNFFGLRVSLGLQSLVALDSFFYQQIDIDLVLLNEVTLSLHYLLGTMQHSLLYLFFRQLSTNNTALDHDLVELQLYALSANNAFFN
jgi:hypothetical protein